MRTGWHPRTTVLPGRMEGFHICPFMRWLRCSLARMRRPRGGPQGPLVPQVGIPFMAQASVAMAAGQALRHGYPRARWTGTLPIGPGPLVLNTHIGPGNGES